MHYDIINGECSETMASMAESSVDAVVCDPPYGLSFMGAEWDSFGSDARQPGDEHYVTPDNPFGRSKVRYGYGKNMNKSMVAYQERMTPIFEEALRVAKPGAYLLCFGGTRTFHRLACAIEDAGWELRDTIMYVYGSGYPKGMDVSKAIDKALGAERKIIGKSTNGTHSGSVAMNHGRKESFGAADGQSRTFDLTVPATDVAKQWDGWNTQIKPAWEPIIVARKPLDGTVAHNVMTWGVGAMNIDGCRIPTAPHDSSRDGEDTATKDYTGEGVLGWQSKPGPRGGDVRGRFPANLVHDGSDEVLELFPDKAGQMAYRARGGKKTKNCYGNYADGAQEAIPHDALGSAARFFYCAKASKSDRNLGGVENAHPTVKPNALMRWLVRLVCPKGGLVLDPFMGSGSTGVACMDEGMSFVGIELDGHYCDIAKGRIEAARQRNAQMSLFEE